MGFDARIYENIFQKAVYSAWLKHTNERDVLEEFLNKRFSEWCNKKELSIVDIGCGHGSAAQRVMNVLDSHEIDYNYTGVDPYLNQLKRFREWLPDDKKIQLVQGTFEDFETEQRYDLGLVVHSLYYTEDLQQALRKVHQLAEKAIIVHHGKEGINTIHDRFPHYVKEGPNIISTYENVVEALDNLGIAHTLNVYPTAVNIGPCKDPQNPDGRKMIKFFLEKTDLPEEILKEVSAFIRNLPDIMNHDIGLMITSPTPSSHSQ